VLAVLGHSVLTPLSEAALRYVISAVDGAMTHAEWKEVFCEHLD